MPTIKRQYSVITGDVANSIFDAVAATSRARYTTLAALLTEPTVLEAIQDAIQEITLPAAKVSVSELRTALLTGLDAAP